MKNSRRLLCLVLALMTLAASSCGGGETNPETTTEPEGQTTTVPEETGRDSIPDNLPAETFGGDTFTIATETNMSWQILQEESNGDVVNDAIYERNLAVEDRFKVKLEVVHDTYLEIGKKVVASIQAGDDDFDLCSLHVINTANYVTQNLFMNWYDIPHIDFSKPWWSDSTVEDLTVNGVCFLAVGDFALSALERTYAVFYNKKLAADYSIPALYPIVSEGKWTQAKALELSKDVYSDLDASGSKSDGDILGWVALDRSPMDAYLWAFGGRVLEKSKNGDIELVYHNEKTGAMIENLFSFFYDNDGIYLYSTVKELNWQWANDHFKDGRAIFLNGSINTAVQQFRDMTDDFGIIPYPKWDEDQENYITVVDGGHDALCVPVTVKDTKKTGIITEALCAESYKKVVPAYYDVALKTKGTRDEESVEMLDMIVGSRVFDLGYIFTGSNGAGMIFENLLREKNPNFESYWASNESKIIANYAEVIDYFNSYGK